MYNLKKFLEECKAAYYAGKPIISDDQYDHLEDICSEDLSVGTNRGKTRHWFRMYSLQKYYPGDNLPNWRDGNYKAEEVETPKLDGAAVAVRYLNGKFDSVVTRGNGEYGEDITHLFDEVILETLYIPETIDVKGMVQITGEVVAPKYIENARNYAAGALNQKEVTGLYGKELKFFAYDMQPHQFDDYSKTLYVLHDYMNFYTVDTLYMTADFPHDGTVVRVNSNKLYNELGFTSKHPRGAFALKERTEGIPTQILAVDWKTGKSGKVTPVAILDPIVIDGATVSRATLNNPEFIKALGVKIGDFVAVERAGGIIPRIIRKLPD